jgi:hypothetical protein
MAISACASRKKKRKGICNVGWRNRLRLRTAKKSSIDGRFPWYPRSVSKFQYRVDSCAVAVPGTQTASRRLYNEVQGLAGRLRRLWSALILSLLSRRLCANIDFADAVALLRGDWRVGSRRFRFRAAVPRFSFYPREEKATQGFRYVCTPASLMLISVRWFKLVLLMLISVRWFKLVLLRFMYCLHIYDGI